MAFTRISESKCALFFSAAIVFAPIIVAQSQITPQISIGNIPTTPFVSSSFIAQFSYSGIASPVEWVASSTPAICTTSGNTVNFINTGTCTLIANAAATPEYTVTTGNPQSIYVYNFGTQGVVGLEPGLISTIIGNGTQAPPAVGTTISSSSLPSVNYLATDGPFLILSDPIDNRIWTYAPNSGTLSSVLSPNLNTNCDPNVTESGKFYPPAEFCGEITGGLAWVRYGMGGGLFFTDAGSTAYVLNFDTAPDGQDVFMMTLPFNFDDPTGAIAADPNVLQNVYFADDNFTAVVYAWSLYGFTGNVYVGTPYSYGCAGDGGPATQAQINTVTALATDSQGNLYLYDSGCSVLRRVAASNGVITTVAGTPYSPGYSGDGGPGAAAQLGSISAMSTDTAGNLYVLDETYQVLRKIDHDTGIISTIAGTGGSGYSGDGGPALNAEFNSPSSLGISDWGPSETIYVADSGNYAVRAIGPDGALNLGTLPINVFSESTIRVSNESSNVINFVANPMVAGNITIDPASSCAVQGSTLAVGASCVIPVAVTSTGVQNGTVTLSHHIQSEGRFYGVSTVYVSGKGTSVAQTIAVQ